MFGYMFAPKKVKTANAYFQKRDKFLMDFVRGKLKVDEKVAAAEVAANTGAILTTLDPLSPIDDYFITDEKKKVIGAFLYIFNKSIIADVQKQIETGKEIGFVKPELVLKRIKDEKWSEKNRSQVVEYFNHYFVDNKDLKDVDLIAAYEEFKGDSALKCPIAYSTASFVNIDELKVKLFHCISLTREKSIDWNRLYLLLASQEQFEDYYSNFINTVETRTATRKQNVLNEKETV